MFSAKCIFHPTDCSPADSTALVHALKLTCVTQAELKIMHVDPAVGREDFEDFPRIRPLLAKWGLLPEGSAKEDVSKLGIAVNKVRTVSSHAVEAILHYLALHPADLLVLSTHQREGLSRLTHPSVAEPIARGAHAKALFLPKGVTGFVSADTGAADIQRILIPVTPHPHPQPAIDAAIGLAESLGCEKVLFELMFLGSDEQFPRINRTERAGWTWEQVVGKGDPADWILAIGKDFDVDLIVMMTEGRNSAVDVLLGSTTERVLRGARAPVLAIPV